MTLEQKIEFYKKLVAGLSKGVHLAAVLGELGFMAEQKQVEAMNDRLGRRAALLRRQIHKKWKVRAATTTGELQAVSTQLQDQIRRIERSTASSERVVKAIGLVDDIAAIAAKVAKAVM